MKTGVELAKHWLWGTTCGRDVVKRSLILENEDMSYLGITVTRNTAGA